MSVIKRVVFSLIILSVFMGLNSLYNSNMVYATSDISGEEWWDKATSWYSGQKNESGGIDTSMLTGITNLIETVGTAVIAIVTVILGIKYMFGSVNGKAEVKENLINLFVACLFFFGWSNIRGILIVGDATGANGINGNTQLSFFQNGDISGAFSQIFTFALVIAQSLCVAVILFLGVKYIFAGADAKAHLKEKSPLFIIGIILIFCTTGFIRFIASVVTSAANKV